MIIRGFSKFTSYNCAHCHHKCCATEYNLPLFPHESENLLKNYKYSSIFIRSINDVEKLIRGDSCPFLTSHGLCLLHDTQNKPLICQIYPLILWKIKPDVFLCWIHPCRGNGFQWVSRDEYHITDQFLSHQIKNVQNHFESYWGDQIDLENPFTDVAYERVQQELEFFEQDSDSDLYKKFSRINDSGNFADFFHTLSEDFIPSSPDLELKKVIHAVLHWLSWNPVSLKLTLPNSKLIFSIAALWIEFHGSFILSHVHNPVNYERHLQQLGSFLATSVTPAFWSHLEGFDQNESIRKFSTQVRKILMGKIPQQAISDLKEF
ncbi:MAG: YkgJ family cysteine cluster protein [Promethearchaeota archaeon]